MATKYVVLTQKAEGGPVTMAEGLDRDGAVKAVKAAYDGGAPAFMALVKGEALPLSIDTGPAVSISKSTSAKPRAKKDGTKPQEHKQKK